jgi:hypothetical protein
MELKRYNVVMVEEYGSYVYTEREYVDDGDSTDAEEVLAIIAELEKQVKYVKDVMLYDWDGEKWVDSLPQIAPGVFLDLRS